MPQSERDVTAAELSVLEALWQSEPATIRELTDRLYPGGEVAHYATVQKLLERLEAKGCVASQRGKGRNVYRSRLTREDMIGATLQDVADRLCAGSLAPLLTQLLEGRRISKREREALRALVDR